MSTTPRRREWVAEPVYDEGTIRAQTGRGWDDWTDLILDGPGADAGHTAIATWLREAHGIDAWWAQGVTVGFERIMGLRLPGQMPDGTFTVSRSRVLDIDPERLRTAWEDPTVRDALLPGLSTERLSRPGVKVPKFALRRGGEDLGILSLSIDRAKDRTKIVVTHDRLPDPDAAERWKSHWGAWLEDLPASPPGD